MNFNTFFLYLSKCTLLILRLIFIHAHLFIYSVSSLCVCLCVCMCEDFDDTLMTIDQWFFFLKDNSLGNLTRFLKQKSSIISINTLYPSFPFLQTQLKFLKWISSISSTWCTPCDAVMTFFCSLKIVIFVVTGLRDGESKWSCFVPASLSDWFSGALHNVLSWCNTNGAPREASSH